MPFVARSRSRGERIDITRIERPRETLQAGDIICQLCEKPMLVRDSFIRAGFVVRSHIAHRVNRDCASQWGAHPESPEHRLGKLVIAERLREELADLTGVRIEYEVPIREVMRIADVMVIYPNGWRVAHECQLASITPETLAQRTEDYLNAGVDIVWWLGKSAATYHNLHWCYEQQGFALELHFGERHGDLPLPVPGHDHSASLGLGQGEYSE